MLVFPLSPKTMHSSRVRRRSTETVSVFFALATALLLVMVGRARADCPLPSSSDPSDPPRATLPCGIVLVGTTNGVADPFGEFTIVYRDAANNPVAGCAIEIDFSSCVAAIALDQPFEGVTMECMESSNNRGIVKATTDGAGIARFRIVGGAFALPTQPALSTSGVNGCAEVRAGSVVLGRLQVASLDLNLSNGANPADLALWLKWSFQPFYAEWADYNCSFGVNPADLAIWLKASFAGGSLESPTGYCQ